MIFDKINQSVCCSGPIVNEEAITLPAIQAWDLSLLVLSSEQVKIAGELNAWLAKFPASLPQAIARAAGGEYANDHMRILEHEIIRQFSPLTKAAKYLQVLCKVVDAINLRSATPLPVPRIPNVAIRPKNPFRSGIPSCLKLTRLWRETLSNSIAKNPVTSDDVTHTLSDADLGRLFTSAALHGGLADPQLLVSLARALEQPKQNIVAINDRLVIELSISWQGELGSEHRFWFADPLTATFIAQLSGKALLALTNDEKPKQESDQHIRKSVWKYIFAFFKATELTKDLRPQSLSSLTKSVKMDLQTRLPQVLVSYAGRSIVSHSPGKHVLARLYGLQPLADTKADSAHLSEPTEQITEFNNTTDNLEDFEPYWLSKLRAAFASQNGTSILIKIDEIIAANQPDSIEYCFALFARRLVLARSAANNKLAPSTARAYLVTVSKRLGGRLGNVDPRTLGAETLEILYGEILADADVDSGTRNQRRRIARALREFHHFLVHEFNFEPINVREVLGIGKGLVPVDANLITYDEYIKILTQIPISSRKLRQSLPVQGKLAIAAKLIFALAFKCGMRRMEVLKLKIADFCEHDPAELLIRPSDARRLKTKSSTRKLPLYALLAQNELKALRDWKTSRLAELTKTSPEETALQLQSHFLFGIPELEFEFISQDTLFDIIHHAMRQVCGDETLRFHHLRHSFASWCFLQLMLSDLPSIPKLFPNLPKTSKVMEDSRNFRNRLYGHPDPTRRHVYAVTSLLGHAGPETSLEHYVHVCDLLLALWLEIDVTKPSQKQVIQAAARPKTTIYRWLSRGPSHVSYRLARKNNLIHACKLEQIVDQQNVYNQPKHSRLLSVLDEPAVFDRLWDVLYRHAMDHTTIQELAASSGFTESMIFSFIEKAEVIRDMKTERGKGGFRHRMIEANLDRRDKDAKSRLTCPVAPHTKKDKAIVKRLAPELLSLFKTNPELCYKVFDYYLGNAWQTHNELIFKDPATFEHAKNFMVFIEALGLKRSEIEYISYDTSERSRALAKWKNNLEFSGRQQFTKIAPPRKTSLTAKNWLGIKPVFTDKNHVNEHGANIIESSIAFRYLMVLGAIIFPAYMLPLTSL